MKRVVPKIDLTAGRLLSLGELARLKETPIRRSKNGLLAWCQRGVLIAPHDVVIYLPHIRIAGSFYSSVAGMIAFLAVLQDYSHTATAMLAEQQGPPVEVIRGDLYDVVTGETP